MIFSGNGPGTGKEEEVLFANPSNISMCGNPLITFALKWEVLIKSRPQSVIGRG